MESVGGGSSDPAGAGAGSGLQFHLTHTSETFCWEMIFFFFFFFLLQLLHEVSFSGGSCLFQTIVFPEALGISLARAGQTAKRRRRGFAVLSSHCEDEEDLVVYIYSREGTRGASLNLTLWCALLVHIEKFGVHAKQNDSSG